MNTFIDSTPTLVDSLRDLLPQPTIPQCLAKQFGGIAGNRDQMPAGFLC